MLKKLFSRLFKPKKLAMPETPVTHGQPYVIEPLTAKAVHRLDADGVFTAYAPWPRDAAEPVRARAQAVNERPRRSSSTWRDSNDATLLNSVNGAMFHGSDSGSSSCGSSSGDSGSSGGGCD